MTWMLLALAALAGPVPEATRQLVVVVAHDIDDSKATLHRFARDGREWREVGAPVPARIGARGVAWGVGLHPAQPGLQKVEGDLRSPAGVFRLGDAYRDDSVPEVEASWPVRFVGPRDLWVEDPTSPHYNEHILVPGDRPLLPWEQSARMALRDPYLALKVFVAHNPPPSIPGAGSAIFLHSGAPDGSAATAGCTAIARSELETVLGWLRPEAQPVFVLLTRIELEALADPWGLPTP